ncbi:unnamed protein product [Aphanomyces euteiches]|nr:hypothetical protein Ae201684P_000015 [Aphanomyces euteiches]
MAAFLTTELSTLDRTLTYASERQFEYAKVGSISIAQDISHVGGTVWDASVVLSHYLDSLGHSTLSGKALLEIGCGTALPSIVAARLGARAVATDLRDVLPFTEAAIRRNCEINSENIRWQALMWGAHGEGLMDLVNQRYDYIVGADIVYNYSFFTELFETLVELCRTSHEERSSTKVLVCFEQRRRDLTELWTKFESYFHVSMVSSPMLDACRERANVFLFELTWRVEA